MIVVCALMLALALTYYLAPNVKQKFAFVTPGSITGTVLLLAASLGFAWYTQSFAD